MRLIAIETATDACSIALYLDGAIHARHQIAPRRHAELVLADIDALLAEAGLRPAQLHGIAFGRGPGSFTGVRIGAAVTQGIALGAGLPVARVSTLAAMAQGVMREQGAGRVIAALDARLGEVYIGRFSRDENGLAAAAGEEAVRAPERVAVPAETGWYAAGAGFAAQEGALARRLEGVTAVLDPRRLPHARDTAVLGARLLDQGLGVTAEQALPVYLRERVARKPSA